MRERSQISSNRLFLNKDPTDPEYKTSQSARYLEDQFSELYKSFEFSSEISFSTFYKYAKKSGEFKKPYRWTDICDYCERGKHLKREIELKLKEFDFNYEEVFEPDRMIKCFEKKKTELVNSSNNTQNVDQNEEIDKINSFLCCLKDYETILVHKNIARIQRSAYNKHHKVVEELNGKILIEVDFKQKIMVGLSPRQVNSEFYNQISRSCLGIFKFYSFFVN